LHPFQFVPSERARETAITLFEKFRYFWEVAECRRWSPIRTILRDKSHIRLSTFGSDFHGELPSILRYIELRCAMHPRKGSTAEHLDELLIGFPTPNENARFHPLVGRVPNCDSMRHVFRGHPDDLRQSLWSELFQTNQANSCNRESSVRFHFEWRRYELLGCGRVSSKIKQYPSRNNALKHWQHRYGLQFESSANRPTVGAVLHVSLLSKEDIGGYRPITRVCVGAFWMYSAHVQWYAPFAKIGALNALREDYSIRSMIPFRHSEAHCYC
jgi:hypothetical protein